MNILLSYPRSGNHLVRFFIELITEHPTYGCKGNIKDVEINKNIFDIEVPFNIKPNLDIDLETYNKNCYYKYHNVNQIINDKINNIKKIIFIIRNPREVLLRHNNDKIYIKGFDQYFDVLDYFLNYKGEKKMFYYEDIITNKEEFIKELYKFLDYDNESKLSYILENIDLLYKTSANGKNRSWNGVQSTSINYYYERLEKNDIKRKKDLDWYLDIKMKNENYKFLKDKFNL